MAPADLISDVETLYEAGADYILVTRLNEAHHLCDILEAIDGNALAAKREWLDARLTGRREILA